MATLTWDNAQPWDGPQTWDGFLADTGAPTVPARSTVHVRTATDAIAVTGVGRLTVRPQTRSEVTRP